jgi:hypothetical protein
MLLGIPLRILKEKLEVLQSNKEFNLIQLSKNKYFNKTDSRVVST